jgi:hypothetical protein
MLAQLGAEFLEIDSTNQQEYNECGPCLLLSATSQVCGPFERPSTEKERRMALAVGIFSGNVQAVLGSMDALAYEKCHSALTDLLANEDTDDKEIICNILPHFDAARFKRISSNTVCVEHLRELIRCGSMIKGCSLSLALPCFALPYINLPCLALPCLALPCLALTFSPTFMLTRDVINYYFEMLTQTKSEEPSLFISSSYFFHKAQGHSFCFHCLYRYRTRCSSLAACSMPHADHVRGR